MNKEKIIYFRIRWRDLYNGDVNNPSKKDHECFNFEPVMLNDGEKRVFGYGTTPENLEGNNYKVHIERICNSYIDKSAEKVDNVIVVFVAKRHDGKHCIVGWYMNATVYRNVQKIEFPKESSKRPKHGDGFHRYHCDALYKDAFMLRPEERTFTFDKRNIPTTHYTPFYDEKNLYYNRVLRYIDNYINKTKEIQSYNQTKTRKRTATEYNRNNKIASEVKKNAQGRCELCNKAAFIDENNEPFLEIHHVKSLSENGPDTADNMVALCPNCHRKLHYGRDKNKSKDELYEVVSRLVRY